MARGFIKDRRMAQVGGVGFIVLGSAMLWDAYENRGKSKPFWIKFLPGV